MVGSEPVRRLEVGDRQADSKLGPSGPRFEFNGAVVVTHKAPSNIKPQPHSLSLWLSGEERIEDAVPNLIRYSRTVIENAHHYFMIFTLREDLHPPSERNGVQGVVDQVSPNLIQLAGETAHPGQAGCELKRYSHRLFARL